MIKMYRTLVMALLLAVSVCHLAFAADTKEYQFVNLTDHIIKELYCTGNGYKSWGENLLGDTPLRTGDNQSFLYYPSVRYWDIKIVWEEGGESTLYKVDFTDVWRLTLSADENKVLRIWKN